MNTKGTNMQSTVKSGKKTKTEISKTFTSVNMRRPGGLSIPELQYAFKSGALELPEVSKGFADQYAIEEKFSEDEIRTFKEAFLFFDTDGDGTMPLAELNLALRAMGFIVTQKEINELSKKLDPGIFSFSE